jgi:hypothetical protein
MLGTPCATAIHDLIGSTLVIHVTYGEEDLILIGLIQYTVVDEVACLVEEIEAQSPSLQSTTDDADIVRTLLALSLLKVSDGAVPLDLHPRPRARGVVDNGELLLPPGGILIDEVPMHHPIAMGVTLLKHHEASRPVIECSLGIRVGETTLCYLNLLETINIVVSSTAGDGFGE